MFLLVMLLMFTISTIIGRLVPPNILELMTTLIGAALMITAGSLALSFHSSDLSSQKPAGLALGAIAIIAGIVFVVDFILSVRKLRSKSESENNAVQVCDQFQRSCSMSGILRIIEILLVLVVLILFRTGRSHYAGMYFFNHGVINATIKCPRGSISLLVMLPMFTISTIIGQRVPNILEMMTSLIGALMMITSGSLAFSYYHPDYSVGLMLHDRFDLDYTAHWLGSGIRYVLRYTPAGHALGALAIIAGILFLVDFILIVRKTQKRRRK